MIIDQPSSFSSMTGPVLRKKHQLPTNKPELQTNSRASTKRAFLGSRTNGAEGVSDHRDKHVDEPEVQNDNANNEVHMANQAEASMSIHEVSGVERAASNGR